MLKIKKHEIFTLNKLAKELHINFTYKYTEDGVYIVFESYDDKNDLKCELVHLKKIKKYMCR